MQYVLNVKSRLTYWTLGAYHFSIVRTFTLTLITEEKWTYLHSSPDIKLYSSVLSLERMKLTKIKLVL